MANIIWKTLGYGKEIFTKLDSGYNFLEQKDFVTHYIDREKQEKNNVVLDGKTSRWYLWKIFKDPGKRSRSYYSDEFIIGSLKYLFEKTPENGTVVIQIWPELSELMNGQQDVQDAFSQHEEKKCIQDIFDRHIRKRGLKKFSKKLVITSFEQTNQKLFKSMRNGAKVWQPTQYLWAKYRPELYSSDMDALVIAKYLYRVCQNNEDFFELIKNTKTQWVIKTEHNSPEYYWMAEIACRLHDFLVGWIYIQWWWIRQQKYDNIIRIILNGDEKYPELRPLAIACQEVLSTKAENEQTFQWVYFDGKKNKEVLEKQKKAREIKIRLRAITYTTMVALAALFTYHEVSKNIEKNRIEKEIQLTIDNAIKDQYIYIRFDNGPQRSVWAEIEYKRQHFNSLSESIAQRFCNEYNIGDLTQQDIKLMVLQLLIKDWIRDIIDGEDIKYSLANKDRFIRNVLIPSFSIQFTKAWTDLEPFKQFREYEDLFKSSINWNFPYWSVKVEKKSYSIPSVWEVDYTDVKKIWKYYFGGTNMVWTYEQDWKKYLVAYPMIELEGIHNIVEPYDASRWQDIAYDYFLQRYPVIEDIFNDFLLMYSKDKSYIWHNNKTECYNDTLSIDNVVRDELNEATKRLIIKHFVNTHAFTKVQKIHTKDDDQYLETIATYLKKFAQDNQSDLEKLWFDIVPYQKFRKYKQAFQNTIDYYKNNKDGKMIIVTFKDMTGIEEQDLWDYKTKYWNIISLKVITYEWKQYILGRENYNQAIEASWMNYSYPLDYSMNEGKGVWEEFLNMVKKIQQQQILAEKSKDKTDIDALKNNQRRRIYNHPFHP